MPKNRFYVTTAIPYVNAAPHIGFALEIVQADVIARYHRLIGDDTFFLTGTDENALKNVQSAEKAGLPEKELVDGKCPEHGIVPETVEEENYFFKLSKYQKQLEKLIESDELKIVPESRKNDVLSFIGGGLKDFSISRSKARAKGWGIPVPGDEKQVIYVWFDALSNYINALGYADDGEKFKK